VTALEALPLFIEGVPAIAGEGVLYHPEEVPRSGGVRSIYSNVVAKRDTVTGIV
jgi:hypothetical protein